MTAPNNTLSNTYNTEEVTGSCSERLLMELKKKGYAEESKGLCRQLEQVLEGAFSYTAIRKWIFDDAMPNTPQTRKAVAEKLNIDLVFWEYGITSQVKEEISEIDNKSFEEGAINLQHHVAVIDALKESGLSIGVNISDDNVLKIIHTSLYVGKTHGVANPDKGLIKQLINLAQPESV